MGIAPISLPGDYLVQTVDAHVLLRVEEFYRFTATYQFGSQQGEFGGRVDEVWHKTAKILLTLAGTDDGRRVFGAAGDAGYSAHDKDVINGTFRYHHGDDTSLVWKRVHRLKSASRRVRK